MSDSRLQEIVTRAVVGRAERRVAWGHTVPAEGITGVLGVHVTDSQVSVKESGSPTVVEVTVDCDLWCGNPKNTRVLRCTSRHTANMNIRTVGQLLGEAEVRGAMIGTARATGVQIGSGEITLNLEADIAVEMNALSRIWVKAYDLEDDALSDLDDDSSGSSSGSELGE